MKKFIKSLAVVLSFVMILTIISPSNVQAAKKITLSKTKVTLYVGKSTSLKLKNATKKIILILTVPKIPLITKDISILFMFT